MGSRNLSLNFFDISVAFVANKQYPFGMGVVFLPPPTTWLYVVERQLKFRNVALFRDSNDARVIYCTMADESLTAV